ncbi:MAG TPA: chemotaxis protein CheX [Clostridia bacterium]|jgi:chemotaxis protein CheX|nr:chemotaxis protein CheX [Clostridia bacterium]
MNIEYINPFIEASQTVLKQLTQLDAKLGKVYLKNSPYQSEDILIMVGLTGKLRGQAVFSINRQFALKIASIMMMGMPVTEFDEMSKSAISEMANMIMGNAATILYNRGINIDITPPSLLVGENMQITTNKMKTVCIPLEFSETDKIDLDISTEG